MALIALHWGPVGAIFVAYSCLNFIESMWLKANPIFSWIQKNVSYEAKGYSSAPVDWHIQTLWCDWLSKRSTSQSLCLKGSFLAAPEKSSLAKRRRRKSGKNRQVLVLVSRTLLHFIGFFWIQLVSLEPIYQENLGNKRRHCSLSQITLVS